MKRKKHYGDNKQKRGLLSVTLSALAVPIISLLLAIICFKTKDPLGSMHFYSLLSLVISGGVGGIISSIMGGGFLEYLKRGGICTITLFLLGLISGGGLIGVSFNSLCYLLIFLFFALVPKKKKRRKF